MNKKIGFIGFGNIASMLTEGLIRSKAIAPTNILANARNYQRLEQNCQKYQITPLANKEELISQADIIVIAVKPTDFADIKPFLIDLPATKFVVSLISGLPEKEYHALGSTKLINAIPNVCISVAKGIFITNQAHNLTDADLATFTTIFSKVGQIYYVPSSVLAIASTIAGCTPAYVAMFCEALSEAAVNFGLDRTTSYQMISQMLIGTANMIQQGLHPAQVKDLVASPKGSTIKGIISLEESGFRSEVIKAIEETQK